MRVVLRNLVLVICAGVLVILPALPARLHASDVDFQKVITSESVESTPTPDPEPAAKSGWNAAKTRYYVKGKAVVGLRTINKKIYYFDKKGNRQTKTQWIRIKTKRYYLKKGIALTGWHYVGSYKYYFHPDGHLSQDLIADLGVKWKKKDIHVKVNRLTSSIMLYARDGKKGYTIPVKAMPASVGKMGTRTKLGTYTMRKAYTYRWRTLMGGVSGQYCTRIGGNYLFHSVLYRRQNKHGLIGYTYNLLGTPASHGCVRLQVADAKIIYEIVQNRNTRVTIHESKSVGPFDRVKLKKIPVTQNFDPSDPAIKKSAKKK